jgi:thymidylate kinase
MNNIFELKKINMTLDTEYKTKTTNIHVVSGCIGSGKTTLIPFLKEYLIKKNRKVCFVKEFTIDTIVEEMNYFYQMVELYKNDKVRLSRIYFWIQDKIISEYENFIKSFKFDKYDDIIFERTYLDTKIFTRFGIRDNFILKENKSVKDFHVKYLNNKIERLNELIKEKSLKFNNIIYINTNSDNCIKRIDKRIINNNNSNFDRKGEKNLNMIQFHKIYENDFKNIYKNSISFDNNNDLTNEKLKEKFINFLNNKLII